MSTIPQALSDLSNEWLGLVLGAPVTAFKVVDSHDGTTGRAVLELEYEHASNLPTRLFVKLPPSDEAQRAFVCSSGMGKREALFYQQLASESPVRVPHCNYAACSDSGERYIMLLEHLEDSGCSFHNAKDHYSNDYLQSVVASFARLHSAYWNSPRFTEELNWLQPPLQHEIGAQLVARALEQHASAMPPVFADMCELYIAQTDEIHRLWNRGPDTLIHGDVHDGNMFMDDSEPGFLDWALTARGPGMRDVGYFLAGTLNESDQQRLGPDLVSYYREQLLSHGVAAPSLDHLMQQYRWHAAYVWVGAVTTLAMGDAWQPLSYTLSSLKRIHCALESLGTVSAIRTAIST
ncbi:MAG: phosphotransferase [Halioglobus sp.]